MQIAKTKRAPTAIDGGAVGVSRGPVRSTLSMYAEAPTEELTLTDFEVLAFERLKGACDYPIKLLCSALDAAM